MSWIEDSANAGQIWALVVIAVLMFWSLVVWIIYKLVT